MHGISLREDAWLGDRLGRKAFHADIAADGWDPQAAARLLAPALRGESVFVDVSVDAARLDVVRGCEDLGFRVADTNLRFERLGAPPRRDCPMRPRPARPEDRDGVTALARRAFTSSRFHRDPLLSKDCADAVKAAWAANFFAGQRGDGLLVAEADGQVAGFLLYLCRQGMMVIDLVAVDAPWRAMGLGTSLVAEAFAASGQAGLVVGTQAANLPALRLYQSLGFRLAGVKYVLHHHGNQHAYRA
ncbi:GNAT family N-acetyltransferase [Solidesulfovibrio sp.]